MAKRGSPSLLHPLAGCGYRQFWKHYAQNWPYDLRSLHVRFLAALAVTLRVPGVFLEGRKHNAAIAAQPLSAGPVFVVGHWRSGTTHLHNLLSQDPQFACISFSRSALPLDCLGKVRPARALMNLFMPKTRGMDKVAIGADMPQEEEMALGALGDICFYKCFYFPRGIEKYFRRSVLLENLVPGEREKLASAYRFLAQKMAYAHGGKTVLFKNPASTARLTFLKEAFPNAKFVHIVRDPYSIYPSMLKLWGRLPNALAWQRTGGVDFDEFTLSAYERTMRAHLADREKLPATDYHELRFEDLEADPAATLARIYDALALPGKSVALAATNAYLARQGSYQKNAHHLTPEQRERIAARWAFAFDRWEYEI